VSIVVGTWAFIAVYGPDFVPLWAAAMLSCVVALPTLFFVVVMK
jgi:hypothetical protein